MRSAYILELTLLIFLTLYSVVVVGQGIVKLFSSCDELLIVLVTGGAATSTSQVELVLLERIGAGGGGQGHMVVLRMTHVSSALPSVPNLLSLFPGLIDHGTVVFRVLGMLGHTHNAAGK